MTKMREFVQLEVGVDLSNAECRMSDTARLPSMDYCSVRDVVLVRDEHGPVASSAYVWAHLDVDEVPMSLVSLYPLKSSNNGWAEWDVRDGATLVATERLGEPLIWTRRGDVVRTLLPENVLLAVVFLFCCILAE